MQKLIKRLGFFTALLCVVASPTWATPTYTTAVKTARMTAVVTAIDAGGAAGKLEIGTASMATTLCTTTLNYNPAGTVSGTVLTLSGFPKTCTATATGTAAAARIRTSANTDIITGLTVTVNGGGGDYQLDNPSLVAGQTATINASTFTHVMLMQKYWKIVAGVSFFDAYFFDYSNYSNRRLTV